MTYETFKEQLRQHMQAGFPADAIVTIQSVIKNNNIQLDGLSIMEPNVNISPTIYLNHYYEEYQNGRSMDEIHAEILHIYQENKPRENIDISFFTDYENVKSRIVFKLVNYEKNRPLLENIPYIPYLDLAIVFYCLVSAEKSGNATILIHNRHLDYWNITKEDLYQQAMENTPDLLSYDLRNMTEIMEEMLRDVPGNANWNSLDSEELAELDFLRQEPTSYPMYVLSNTSKLNGACCILYHDLLKKFSAKLKADLFVLPSSIHEVILIPAYTKDSITELNQMVRDVNFTQLTEDEILSDHVYYFSRKENHLSMTL